MSANPSTPPQDETKGLRRFRQGAVLGLAGGVIGLVLPISVNLFALYAAVGILPFGTTLIALTSLFVAVGSLFLAISLICYRFGFGAMGHYDRWFLVATVLCTIGSIGLLLIVVSIGLALNSTPSLDQCIRGAPSHTLTCLKTVAPLTAYSVVAGFWLAWLGGLGIVVGLAMGGQRYRETRLVAGGAAYGLLLLVLIAPFLGLLFPVGGWQYPLLTVPIIAVLAPALVYDGSQRRLASQARVR